MAKKQTIYDLVFDITSKGGKGLERDLQAIKTNILAVNAAQKQLGKDWGNFTKNARNLALGVVGSVTALTAATVGLATKTADYGDQVFNTANKLKMGYEGYQKLKYALESSGLSAGSFDKGIQQLNKNLANASTGNKSAQQAFAKWGLSFQKINKLDPADRIKFLSEKLKTIKDPAKQASFALDMFGKAGPEFAVALGLGSDAIAELEKKAVAMGYTLTDEQVRQSNIFKQAQGDLGKQIEAIGMQLSAPLMEPLTRAFILLQEKIQDNMPAIQELGRRAAEFVNTLVDKLPEIIAKIQEFARQLWGNITAFKDFVGGWQNVAKIAGALVIAPTFLSGLKVVISSFQLFHTVMMAGKAGVLALFSPTTLKAIMAMKKGVMALNVAFAANPVGIILAVITAIATGLLLLYQHNEKFRNSVNAVAKVVKEGLGKAVIWVKSQWFSFIEWIKNVPSTIVSFFTSLPQKIASIIEGLPAPIQAVISVIEGYIEVFKAVWATAFDYIKTAFQVVVSLFKGDFGGAFELIQGFIDRFKDRFTGAFDAIKNKIQPVIDLINQLISKLANSGVGQFFGNAKQAIGNFFSGGGQQAVQAHATGGIFNNPHLGMVAEAGPEAVIPLNNSANGQALWQQAGLQGGYLPQPTMAGVGTTNNASTSNITFSPNITVQGGGGDVQSQVTQAIKMSMAEFKAMWQQMQRDGAMVRY
jgi:phage-related protein